MKTVNMNDVVLSIKVAGVSCAGRFPEERIRWKVMKRMLEEDEDPGWDG